jgi:hypothetical protein
MAPSKKAATLATNGQTSHARSHSPAAIKSPAPQASPTPSASHLPSPADLGQEKSSLIRETFYVEPNFPIVDKETGRKSHHHGDNTTDFSCLETEVNYEFSTEKIELYVKEQEDSVTTLTKEFSANLDLQHLLNKDVDGETRFFLDNEVNNLKIKIDKTVLEWKTQVLKTEIDRWIRVQVEAHVKEEYSKVIERQTKIFMELKSKLQKEHERYVLRLKEEHRHRIQMAVLKAVTGTWAHYKRQMKKMKLELTVNFQETMMSEMWIQNIGWAELELEEYGVECPHDFEPNIMLGKQRTLHQFRLC